LDDLIIAFLQRETKLKLKRLSLRPDGSSASILFYIEEQAKLLKSQKDCK